MIGREHGEQSAALNGIVNLVLRTGVGVMKVPWAKPAPAHVQVAGKNIKILWPFIDMSRVTDAWLEFAQQNGVTSLPLNGQKLDPRARDGRKLFPALLIIGIEKAQATRHS